MARVDRCNQHIDLVLGLLDKEPVYFLAEHFVLNPSVRNCADRYNPFEEDFGLGVRRHVDLEITFSAILEHFLEGVDASITHIRAGKFA